MRIRHSEGSKFLQGSLTREFIFVVLFIILGMMIFHAVEDMPWFTSLYFTIVTMATIGFGDVTPKTDLGRMFVMIYALLGVPLFVSLSGLILESRFNRRIKSYITRLHTELHVAEQNIKAMEDEVSDELTVAIKEASKQAKKTEKVVEDTEEEMDKAQEKIEKTEKQVRATEKEVEHIGDALDEDIKKTARWRRKIF